MEMVTAYKFVYIALPRKLEMAVISSTAMDQTSSGVCRPIPCPQVSCLMTRLRNQRVNQSLSPVYGMTFLTVDISSPNISRHMVLTQSKIEFKLVDYIQSYVSLVVYLILPLRLQTQIINTKQLITYSHILSIYFLSECLHTVISYSKSYTHVDLS